jgi:rhodanese-related sulfurtransferase
MKPEAAFVLLDHFRIVDVREEPELHGPLGRIEGAESLPLSQLAERLGELDGHEPLLFVCRSGKRSGMACEQVVKQGRAGVTNLVGGMIGWHRAGLPSRRIEPDSLAALVEQIVVWSSMVGPQPRPEVEALFDERLAKRSVTRAAPSAAAVEELIGLLDETFAELELPDLDLSLDAFRRSLAVL